MSLGHLVVLRLDAKRLCQVLGEGSEGFGFPLIIAAKGTLPSTRSTGADEAHAGEETGAESTYMGEVIGTGWAPEGETIGTGGVANTREVKNLEPPA
jgi:hypothetical protein